jgi:peptide/nickel transport system permease protein
VKSVLRLVAVRLLLSLLVLWAVSAIIFFSMELLPGDIATQLLGQNATPETLAALRTQLNLDTPALLRYMEWLGNAVRGDFGTSIANGRPVSEIVMPRLLNTLSLAAYTAVLGVPAAVALGLVAALFRQTLLDRVLNTFAVSTVSLPEFFIAYLLILLLAIKGGFFPTLAISGLQDGFGAWLNSTLLPALTLSLVILAQIMRLTRAAVINVLGSPYIEMAYLKGIRPSRVITRHALPNATSPIINVIAFNVAYLITGVVIVEVVFAYPGLGQLLVDSVSFRDLPVVQAACLLFALTYVTLNLIADVLSIMTNPRLMHPRDG